MFPFRPAHLCWVQWVGAGSPWFVSISCDMMSIGTGKMIVLLFSAEIELRVCRYLSWGGRRRRRRRRRRESVSWRTWPTT